jgi:NADH-quinone oxidoreductase subunit K
MTSIPTSHALILSGVLMLIGTVGVLARRNLVFVLMSLEIILSSVGIAFVAAASKWHQPDGQVVVIFILVVAAAEVGVGLSLVLSIFRKWKTVDSDEVSSMKG